MKITKAQIIRICEKIKKDFIDYSFLARGAHNESFIIETKQNKLVLRIENNTQVKNLKKEYNFLKKTNGKFGPKVFLFDASKLIISKDYFIEEFLVGEHPEKITNDFIISSAGLLKQLHKIQTKIIPKFAEINNHYSISKSSHFQGLDLYQKYREILPENLQKQLDLIYNNAGLLVNDNERIFAKRKLFSLNHGDLYRENIFYIKGKVKLIDWEFVKYDLLEWDLVSFIYFSNLGKKQGGLFLDSYGYGKKSIDQKKINLILLLHVLWMISWWVQRLSLAQSKKIDKKMHLSGEKDLFNEINKDLQRAGCLIKNLNKLNFY